MASAWPSTIQQAFNQGDFALTDEDNVIRSTVDIGKPKRRRRYTASRETFNGSFIVDATGYAVFKAFFDTTLAAGSLPFTHDHPITGTSADFEFLGPYSLSVKGGYYYQVTISFREVPS